MNSRKRASIIVISVFIAACALFTAVYDGLKSRDVSPTAILNAATVDHTGKNTFSVTGMARHCNITTTLSFDKGVWMVLFWGQNGYNETDTRWDWGRGAQCLAFYKDVRDNGQPTSMTVQIGIADGQSRGGGKTMVTTNFAKPEGYGMSSNLVAVAGGAGYGGCGRGCGVFKGRDGVNWSEMGGIDATNDRGIAILGAPASQTSDGYRYDGVRTMLGTNGGGDGGYGYFNGGGGYGDLWIPDGGGGSCTPWCYPIFSGDMSDNTWLNHNDGDGDARFRAWTIWGGVKFYRMDPSAMPSGAEVNLAEDPEATAGVTAGGVGAYTPVSAVEASGWVNYDCGIETGWVFRTITELSTRVGWN